MSGHSHWHGIRHKKALTDAKKASVFTKFGKLLTIAAKEGGGDPSMNVRLRLIVDQARSANMPKENIERAIKRGTGELKEGGDIQETVYEGLLPLSQGEQITMMIQVATDNKNRAVSEIKSLLKKSGGQMVPNGSVGYLFENVGIIEIPLPQNNFSEEGLEMTLIASGAKDLDHNAEGFTLYTQPKDLKEVENVLSQKNILFSHSTLGYRSTQLISLQKEAQEKYDLLLEQLDEQEDVQAIYDNTL